MRSILILLLAAATPALAHHSFAAFDSDKLVALDGSLYRVQWSNPHSWIWVAVPDGKGGETIWALEGAAPNAFSRLGFTKKDFAVGNKMKVDIHPLRDGSQGGQFLRVTYPDGRVVGDLRTPVEVLKAKGYGAP